MAMIEEGRDEAVLLSNRGTGKSSGTVRKHCMLTLVLFRLFISLLLMLYLD